MSTADGYTAVGYGGVQVLRAANDGGYPYGNSVLVTGSGGTLLIDPSLALSTTPESLGADAVLVSHAHEDHLVGLGASSVPVHVHEADLAAVHSSEVLLAGYGLPHEAVAEFAPTLVERFRVASRPDATGFPDGHRFDLGDRSVTVVHLPGHTMGHSGFLIEPDDFLYVADIDLTSFGPFYGDLGSSLEDFESSLRRCDGIDARWYGTFHQKGVIEGADEFRERLGAYLGVIERRDAAILEFLREPRSLEDAAERRFVYRAHVEAPYVPSVERRTAEQHVDRLVRQGRVGEVEPGRFRSI